MVLFWWSGRSLGAWRLLKWEVGVFPSFAFENFSQLSLSHQHAEHDLRNAQEPLQGPPVKWAPNVSGEPTAESSIGGWCAGEQAGMFHSM